MNPLWKFIAVLGLAVSFAPNPVLIHTAAAESKPFHWLFAGNAAAALALNADASRLLDGTEPFVFSGPAFKDLPPGWKAIPIAAFKSFGDVRNALADNTLASNVTGVMYDYENWRFTPEEEQKIPRIMSSRPPILFMRMACCFSPLPLSIWRRFWRRMATENIRTRRICGWALPPMPPGMLTFLLFSRNGSSAIQASTQGS